VLLHLLAKRENENCVFTLCNSALPEFDQSLPNFFNLLDSRLILTLLYDLLNLVMQSVQFGAFGGMVQEKGSRQRCRSWTVLHVQSTSALSSGFPLSQGNANALERWGGKQSTVWLLTFSVTLTFSVHEANAHFYADDDQLYVNCPVYTAPRTSSASSPTATETSQQAAPESAEDATDMARFTTTAREDNNRWHPHSLSSVAPRTECSRPRCRHW